jgi:hypothetical protein
MGKAKQKHKKSIGKTLAQLMKSAGKNIGNAKEQHEKSIGKA